MLRLLSCGERDSAGRGMEFKRVGGGVAAGCR